MKQCETEVTKVFDERQGEWRYQVQIKDRYIGDYTTGIFCIFRGMGPQWGTAREAEEYVERYNSGFSHEVS